MNIVMQYLASLVHASLDKTEPMELPSQLKTEEILDISDRNQMDYILLCPFIKAADLSEEQFHDTKMRIKWSLMRTLVQVNEIKALCKDFEEKKVKNQPMKGSVLKFLYPSPALREMSDIDVLIWHEDMENAKEVLKENEYILLEEELHHHDVYYKGNFMVLEAHHAMYDKEVDLNQYEYFKNMSRAKLRPDCAYTYDFTKEDFYVYMMSHMAKHFYQMGCGIRNLVDVYVYRNAYDGQMDEDYIDRELDKCGILSFTKHIEKLTRIWLKGEESSDFYEDLFIYMCDSGIYGKDENGIWNEFAKKKDETKKDYNKKLKKFYYFPPYSYMVKYYPWVKDKKFLLPFAWIDRGIVGLAKKKGSKKRELISHIDAKNIKTIQKIYSEMQFDFHKC